MENGFEYEITEHAKIQLKKRQVDIKDIIECLKNPGQVIPVEKGRQAYQSKFAKHGETYLIRVVVEKEQQCLKVITVYLTSKIDKYWKEK